MGSCGVGGLLCVCSFFFFKQKTAYEMRISDWSSDVCSSDLSALARHYPGGTPAFVRAMNARAKSLGMNHTHYHDSNGLSSEDVSTAQDLVHLVNAVYKVPLIRDFSTHVEKTVKPGRRSMHFVSSNRLVRASNDRPEARRY